MTAETRAAAGTAQGTPGLQPAQVAKAAFRRLALAKLEPTPENYARAYDDELGQPARAVLPERAAALLDRLAALPVREEAARGALRQAFVAGAWPQAERLLERAAEAEGEQSRQLAATIERLVRGLERNDRQWTLARKKESLHTVIDGSRGDAPRLLRRLTQLLAGWEGDAAGQPTPAANDAAGQPTEAVATAAMTEVAARGATADAGSDGDRPLREIAGCLGGALARALPGEDASSAGLAAGLDGVLAQLAEGDIRAELVALARSQAEEAERLLRRREQLLRHSHDLCRDLADGLADVAEDDSWARGQCEAMRDQIAGQPSVRAIRSAGALLHHTRVRQRELRVERAQARDALKSMIHQMLQEVGELGQQTGRFHESVGRYADVIERADSLEGLAGAVREMVAESRTVQGLVSAAQQRLQDEHARATELSDRVQTLESELRRLSDEVSTDQLTQIANRRGLLRAFETECSRADRGSGPLVLALLDVDDFKRLNDSLGHGAGDEALRSLAARVSQQLRPSDTVARYGGEEFVVMLPSTPVEEAQQVLSRMQRAMTQALFMHESNPVFVTFSAGMTLHREGERLEQALERADEALYEAKRTGKNRTCVS